MKSILVSFLFLFSFSTFAADCDLAHISGVYRSEIQGGGNWNETVFYVDADGSLQGLYFMYFDQPAVGKFSNLKLHKDEITGEWQDEFGVGSIEFKVAPDCTEFSGLWDNAYTWKGVKNVQK